MHKKTHMKIKLSLIVALMTGMIFASCSPEDFGDVVGPVNNNINNLTGNWRLTKVTQTDLEASLKNSPFVSSDITTEFPYSDFRLAFNSAAGAPTTFTTTPGNSPRVIRLASGNWRVDNVAAPGQVQFINGVDTVKALFGSYPSSFDPTFKLRVDRINTETGKATMRYDYQFVKQ
jgi:hypothetical protein